MKIGRNDTSSAAQYDQLIVDGSARSRRNAGGKFARPFAAMTYDLAFDLTGDGSVDQSDLQEWLAVAGGENLASGNPYLIGDVHLDGVVDGLDFVAWNAANFTATAAWTSGGFNADGVVDGQDFVQ